MDGWLWSVAAELALAFLDARIIDKGENTVKGREQMMHGLL